MLLYKENLDPPLPSICPKQGPFTPYLKGTRRVLEKIARKLEHQSPSCPDGERGAKKRSVNQPISHSTAHRATIFELLRPLNKGYNHQRED